MATSFYDFSVANYLQTLGAVSGFLAKGREHCLKNGIDLGQVVETKLVADMLPFRFQVVSVVHHSLGAIRGIETGVFSPPAPAPDLDYAALEKLVTEARTGLQAYEREAVDALETKDVAFKMGERGHAVRGARLRAVVLAAELLLPRHDGVRHPAHEGCADRQARLHGDAANQDLKPQAVATSSSRFFCSVNACSCARYAARS